MALRSPCSGKQKIGSYTDNWVTAVQFHSVRVMYNHVNKTSTVSAMQSILTVIM